MKIDLRDYTPDISDEELKESEQYLKTRAFIQKNLSDSWNEGIWPTQVDVWKALKSELLHAHGTYYRTAYLMHRAILLALDELITTRKDS